MNGIPMEQAQQESCDKRSAATPERIFAFLLVPMASWQVWIFPSLPNYYAQHFFIWPCLIFMGWAWARGLWNLGEAWCLARPFLPWLALLLTLQTWADWQSASVYAPDAVPRAVAVSLLKLLVQLPFLLFFALLFRVLLRREASRRAMLAGALVTFGLLCLLCAVQAVFVYSIGSDWGRKASGSYGTLYAITRWILVHVSPWLEARWPVSVYDFYSVGGYTLKIGRINGFFEEASALVAVLAVFFLPLGFGLLSLASRNLCDDGKPCRSSVLVLGWIVIIACLVLFLLCLSLTGLIVAVVLCVLGLRPLVHLRRQGAVQKAVILFLLAGAAAVCLYVMKDGTRTPVFTYFEKWFQQTQKRIPPRIIVSFDTLEIIARHPMTGVGRDWYFSHLHEGQRFMENLDDPEIRFWKRTGSGGELSALPALVAKYGLPVALAAVFFAAGICRRLCRLHRSHPRDALLAFTAGAAPVWFSMGICISLASVDVRNPLFSLPFYCFLAVVQGVGVPPADSRQAKAEGEDEP